MLSNLWLLCSHSHSVVKIMQQEKTSPGNPEMLSANPTSVWRPGLSEQIEDHCPECV